MFLAVFLTASLLGCEKTKPNLNEAAFKEAAGELPAAEAYAHNIGLAYRRDDLIHHVPSAENAAGHYELAFAMLKKQPLWVEPIEKLDAASLDSAKKQVAKAAPILVEVKKACALPHCYLSPTTARVEGMDFGRNGNFKLIAKLLCLRARVEAHSGNFAAAGSDIGCVAQLMKHSMEYPTLIDWLVAYSIHSNAVQTVDQIVTEQLGNPKCAGAMLQGMSKFPNSFSIAAVIPQETVMYMTLMAPAKGDENALGMGEKADSNDPDLNALIRATDGVKRRTIMEAFETRHLQVYTALYEIASDKSLSEIEQVNKMCSVSDKAMKSGPTYYQIGEFRQAWTSFVRYQAMQEVTLLGLQKLSNLGGALPKTAADPFTKGPLHFKQRPGGFVIYSVGPNLKDDGGSSKSPGDDVAFSYPYIESKP